MRDIDTNSIRTKFPNEYNIDNEFLLYDQTTGLPQIEENSRLHCLVLAICTAGEINYTIDTVPHKVEAGDIIIASEGQVIGNYTASSDCNGVCLVISYDFFQEIVSGIRELSALFLFAKKHPVFRVNKQKTEELLSYIKLVKEKLKDTQHSFRREMIASFIKVMIYDMCNVISQIQQLEKNNGTRAEIIFADFIRMVERDFRHERRVSAYANKLFLTPKYLSETIKSVSQRTPSEWIEYYVMLEIRVLLKNSRMSIKEIAKKLNFPNQSFLGKYFKEHYGMSPSQYRKS